MKKNYLGPLQKMDRKIRWLFVFSVVAFVCFMGILYQQKRSQEATRLGIYNTYSTIKKLEKINTLVVETESATRAYLLTRDSVWKETLEHLHRQLADSVNEVRNLTRDTDNERRNITMLEVLSKRKIDYQDSMVAASVVSESMLQKVRADGEARRITVAIREVLSHMIQLEEQLLSSGIAKNERDYNTGVSLALFGGVFAFILILAILFQLNGDISRRRKAEEGLTRSEAKYRNLIENAGVVMFTADVDGRITFANNHVLQLTGYPAEELLGKHFSILIDNSWIERVVTFYRNQFQKRIPVTTLHFLTRSRSGKEIWVEQFAQLLFEGERIVGFQCMVRDITEKKMIESELEKSELKRKENEFRLNSILENTTALIFIKDLEGKYIMVNRRFKEVFGLTDAMVINRSDYDFNPPELADHYRKLDDEIKKTLKPIETEELIDTKEGPMNLLLLKFPLIDDKGRAFGISGIATDITERTQSRVQLEMALQEARAARELQEQFLANMSHEIRTPMNGIHGMTSLLLETSLSEEQKEFATMIKRSLNNLTAIVNDILDISNLKTGKLTLARIVFNINDPVEAVRSQFAHEAKAKKLAFNITMDERLPTIVVGDPYRLKQVLVSLVGNAVKFTNKGAVSVHVSLKEQRPEGPVVLFRIADTGIGIPDDKLEKIFESFAQADMNISKGYGGAGLGLAISKGLVQIQGGEISAQSRTGEGSVFSFYIPYGLPQEADETGDTGLAARLRGKRFLVVEDNEVNQKLIGFVLQKVGGIIDIAGNGKEAVAYFEEGRTYDLVIMDLQMPVMDGYQTATYIRKQLKLTMPIIALTATALKGDQEKCRQVGMNDFMLKPFDFKDLYRRLVRLLFHEELPGSADTEETAIAAKKIYDLSLLEELDDKESLLDVISLFLDNTPPEVAQLKELAASHNWNELYRLSHKIKGAVAILQATPLAQLLGSIEEKAREQKDLDMLVQQMAELEQLFSVMEAQLRKEQHRLQEELSG